MSIRKIAFWAVGTAATVVVGGTAWMLGPALMPPQDVAVGVEIEDTVPVEMELRYASGDATSLAANMGERGMVLLFVRSAEWCPVCQRQLIDTEDIREAVTGSGFALAGLSYDEPAILAEFAANKGIGYLLFSDKGSRMIDALGLRDPQYEPGSKAHGVPRATILVLAPDGKVKKRHVSADYRSRPSNEDVLAMIDEARD